MRHWTSLPLGWCSTHGRRGYRTSGALGLGIPSGRKMSGAGPVIQGVGRYDVQFYSRHMLVGREVEDAPAFPLDDWVAGYPALGERAAAYRPTNGKSQSDKGTPMYCLWRTPVAARSTGTKSHAAVSLEMVGLRAKASYESVVQGIVECSEAPGSWSRNPSARPTIVGA